MLRQMSCPMDPRQGAWWKIRGYYDDVTRQQTTETFSYRFYKNLSSWNAKAPERINEICRHVFRSEAAPDVIAPALPHPRTEFAIID